MIDESPPLHPIRVGKIPSDSWVPASVEPLPDGWVNVHIYAYDRIRGCDLYITDSCPAILHLESTVTVNVMQLADADGEIFDPESGSPYDDRPVVLGVEDANPPHKWHYYVDATFRSAVSGGGYLSSCHRDEVRKVLADNGFPDAIEKPEGWVDHDDE